jgi:hypothetical protein
MLQVKEAVMKYRCLVPIAFLVLAHCSFGQEQQKPMPGDTATRTPTNFRSTVKFEQPVQLLPLSIELAVTPDYYKSIIFQTAGGEPYFFSKREIGTIDLAAPWKLQLARESEHKLMYQVLGAIEAGGVAYLAYEHIRKYGWK